jgi:hypothetical protein
MKPAEDQMEIAERVVAREARRAGREREFETLVPFLHRDPGHEEMAALAQRLPWSGAALKRALDSLRRRVRELAVATGP